MKKIKETGLEKHYWRSTDEAARVVALARAILSELSSETQDKHGNTVPNKQTIPASYNWFGCETDAELLNEIQMVANGEGYRSASLADEDTLRQIVGIMYHG